MTKLNTPEAINAEINGTLALLDTVFNPDEQLCKNVVLLIGITGTGKSTISQFLAGNPNLRAVRYGIAGDFYITDGNEKVSESTTESKTLLPELVPLLVTDTVLADCPGFSDTRSAKHDIAAAVFIKKLLDCSKQAKIMVTTAYHSVRKGVDRTGFTDLLVHVAQFINDIDKYTDSIGLLVTKVDNPTAGNEAGLLQYIEDGDLINEIGAFLNEVKVELMKKPPSANISKQIQLIDLFIAKDGSDNYSKIGIFRRPTEIGDLNSDKRLTKNRDAIKNIMNNVLQSSRVAPNDFGLSLAMESQHIVTKMRITLNSKLSNILEEFIRVYTQPPSEPATDIEFMKTAVSRSNDVVDYLKSAIVPNMAMTQLLEGIYKLDPRQPAQQYYADWQDQQKYIQFLETISSRDDESNDFSKYHMRLNTLRDKMSTNVQLMVQNVGNTIDQAIDKVITEVMLAVKNEVGNLELSTHLLYPKLSDQINGAYNLCDEFKTKSQSEPNLSFKEFLSNIKSNFAVTDNQAQKLESYQTDIEYFKSRVTATFTDGHQEKWLNGFTVACNDIKRVADWYSFITDSYSKLTDYKNLNKFTNRTSDLKNWEGFKISRQQLDANSNLNKFLESRTTLSTQEQSDLNNLVDAIQPSLEYACESSKLVVKANLVKLSRVATELFPKCASFTDLYVFATQTVFIDVSLTEPGKNVYIVAPTWNIKGSKVINLRGVGGKDKDQSSSSMAGNPGQPGGNFVGIGESFINENDLTIDVSGGNGGNGVDGEKGWNGWDGMTPKKPVSGIYMLWQPICERDVELKDIAGFFNLLGQSDEQWTYKKYGSLGTRGHSGSDGGKPGYGAKSGSIFVNSSNINQIAISGVEGIAGKGGKGGTGGEHGKTILAICHRTSKLLYNEVKILNTKLEPRGHAPNGVNGVSGIEGSPEVAPEPKSFEPVPAVAMKYKQYAKQKQSRFVDPLKFINPYVLDSQRQSVNAKPEVNNTNMPPKPSVNLGAKFWGSEFSLPSFMALADVLIRKLMKTKPASVESQADPNWENLLVQAEVLKIVEKCEANWNELYQDEAGQKPFDPLCLQKELYSRLKAQGDKSQVEKIEAEVFEKMFA